ncbi:MAG: hypothetical protein U9O56_00425 [Campylobacterota bacterium]|nr:hypothetical protein [Campylobacterota bacterium]
MNINNTFWTIIDDNYYRIHNGILKYAPIDIDNSIITDAESSVDIISIEKLELINQEFGSTFTINDF